MARGEIVELPNSTGLALFSKILTICSSAERTYSELFADDLIAALSDEYGERVIRDHVSSMARLGFLNKSSLTHIRFKTSERGEALIGKRKR